MQLELGVISIFKQFVFRIHHGDGHARYSLLPKANLGAITPLYPRAA